MSGIHLKLKHGTSVSLKKKTKKNQTYSIFKIKIFQYQGLEAALKSLIAGNIPAQLFIPRSLETVNTYLNRKTL